MATLPFREIYSPSPRQSPRLRASRMSAASKSKTSTTFSSSNSPNLLAPDNRKRQEVPQNNNPPPVPAARPDANNDEANKAINMKLVSKDNPALQLDLPTRDKVMNTFDSRLPDEEHLYNLPIPSLMKFFVHPF